jgi:hypothetical protein
VGFREDRDIVESTVTVNFYPRTVCCSHQQKNIIGELEVVTYLFNLIFDICFNEYATIASGSVAGGLTSTHWLDWEISGSIVLCRSCMREEIPVQSSFPSTARPTAVTNCVARRMVC